jgi:hypothetical protein
LAILAIWITAICALQAVLAIPVEGSLFAAARLLAPPIELAALVGLLAVARGRLRRALAGLFAVLLSALAVLKAIDAVALSATGRYFNPLTQVSLLDAGWTFLSGTLGVPAALGLVAALLAALAGAVWAIIASVRVVARAGAANDRRRWRAFAALAMLATAAALVPATRALPEQGIAYVARHVRVIERTLAEERRFVEELLDDPFAETSGDALLQALAGKDVLIVFVESYGRSSLEDPRYAGLLGPRLDAVEAGLADAGFLTRSGWLASPTIGGQSWLAHGALLSGLWTSNGWLYDRMLESRRPTLNALFRRAGWRTVALMPAITEDWPEADYFGYDAAYRAPDLGYRGEPYNWVTMPDQYTLSALQRLELGRADRPPLMAEVALVSSHAPWTPVPRLVDWDIVGDGSVFDAAAVAGDPPSVVWADGERVRRQYAETLDYSLAAVGEFVARYGDDDLVVFVLGDHQAAPMITGLDAGPDVPIHVMTRDRAVLDRLAGWGWQDGMHPDPDGPVLPMNAFRNRLLETFAEPLNPSPTASLAR